MANFERELTAQLTPTTAYDGRNCRQGLQATNVWSARYLEVLRQVLAGQLGAVDLLDHQLTTTYEHRHQLL